MSGGAAGTSRVLSRRAVNQSMAASVSFVRFCATNPIPPPAAAITPPKAAVNHVPPPTAAAVPPPTAATTTPPVAAVPQVEPTANPQVAAALPKVEVPPTTPPPLLPPLPPPAPAAGFPGLIDDRLKRWKTVEWWQRGLLAGIGICMGVGGVVFLLWDTFRSDATHQTKKVASTVLSDVEMRRAAFDATKQLVNSVLNDDDAVELLVGVIQRLLAQDTSRQSVALFLKNVFEDTATQEVTKLFILEIVRDAWVRDQLLQVSLDLVRDLLKTPTLHEVTVDFLVATTADALKNADLHKQGGLAVRNTIAEAVNPLAWMSRSSPAPTVPLPPPQTKAAVATAVTTAPPAEATVTTASAPQAEATVGLSLLPVPAVTASPAA